MDIKSIPNHELERLKQKAQELSGSKTDFHTEYSSLLARRLNNEPLQYIEEFMPFYTVQLRVDERALIPRPETEYLIEVIKNKVKDPKNILDVGTGSGCIVVSLLKERPKCVATAIDISRKAINVAKTNAKYLFIDFSAEAGFYIFKNAYGTRVSVLDWIYNACELADFPIENVTFMHGNSKLEESYEQWYENVGAKIDVPKLAQAKFLNTWDDVVNSAHVDYYEQIDREGKFIKPYVYTFYNGADRQHRLDLLKKLSQNNLLKHGVVTYLEDPKTNDPELDGLEFPIMLPSGSDSNHYDVNSHKKDVNPEFLYSHNWAYLDVVTETIIGTQPIGHRYSFSEAPEWWQTTF